MRLRTLMIVFAVVAVAASSADAIPSIGLFSDQTGMNCAITAPAYAPVTFYVVAFTGGALAGGMTGAEFRILGKPATFFGNYVAQATALVVGSDPLIGMNVAFPTCQQGPVLLLTFNGFNNGPAPTGWMTIDRHSTPSNPNFPCPLMTKCDAPYYTIVCVTGMQAVLNGSCTVAVNTTTWTNVKELYGH